MHSNGNIDVPQVLKWNARRIMVWSNHCHAFSSITYFLFNQNWITQSLSSISKCMLSGCFDKWMLSGCLDSNECRDICILSKLYRFVSMWAVAEIKTIVHVCKHEHQNARCASIRRWFLFQFSFPRRINSFTTKWFSSWKMRCDAFCIRLCTKRSSWSGDLPLSWFNFFPSWTF